MDILQDKDNKIYFIFLTYMMGSFILLTLFLSWLHGKESQRILFEREQTMISSLMEQGVARTSIA